MAQVQSSLSVCAWFAEAAQGMGERNRCHVSVSGTLRSGREPRFVAGVTLELQVPGSRAESRSVRAGWLRAGPMAAGHSPAPCVQLPALQGAARSSPDCELPPAPSCSGLLWELWLGSSASLPPARNPLDQRRWMRSWTASRRTWRITTTCWDAMSYRR